MNSVSTMTDMSPCVVDDAARGTFRVHRRALTDQSIFALERERLFATTWNYVGHETELPERGAFRRRTIAGRPLIFVRDASGRARVFFNTCTHRGALICRQDEGVATAFQCFYHAWTFNTNGEVAGVPDRAAYPADFDWDERALREPAEVDSYRGLVFARFTAGGPSLSQYLGSIIDLIDLSLDAAEVLGGWTVLPGSSVYRFHANWKLMIENSIDNYHFDPVHETYRRFIGDTNKRSGEVNAKEVRLGFGRANGHGGFVMGPSRVARTLAVPGENWPQDERDQVQEIRDRLFARFGAERATPMAEDMRSLLIFPNLMFQDSGTGFRLRQIEPIDAQTAEVRQWELVPRDEPPKLRRRRLANSRLFLGPGGFASPDDLEAVESCQLGFGATEVEWSDISRGTRSETSRDTDEEQLRNFWREWGERVGLFASRVPVEA
jgi:p-cumate 2,3-dioxygenase subunit alpha